MPAERVVYPAAVGEWSGGTCARAHRPAHSNRRARRFLSFQTVMTGGELCPTSCHRRCVPAKSAPSSVQASCASFGSASCDSAFALFRFSATEFGAVSFRRSSSASQSRCCGGVNTETPAERDVAMQGGGGGVDPRLRLLRKSRKPRDAPQFVASIDTATASVIVRSTRSPDSRPAAKSRIPGFTVTVCTIPSGVTKVAMPDSGS
jgi:hypothetical protein